jgi:hypothetical protein
MQPHSRRCRDAVEGTVPILDTSPAAVTRGLSFIAVTDVLNTVQKGRCVPTDSLLTVRDGSKIPMHRRCVYFDCSEVRLGHHFAQLTLLVDGARGTDSFNEWSLKLFAEPLSPAQRVAYMNEDPEGAGAAGFQALVSRYFDSNLLVPQPCDKLSITAQIVDPADGGRHWRILSTRRVLGGGLACYEHAIGGVSASVAASTGKEKLIHITMRLNLASVIHVETQLACKWPRCTTLRPVVALRNYFSQIQPYNTSPRHRRSDVRRSVQPVRRSSRVRATRLPGV